MALLTFRCQFWKAARPWIPARGWISRFGFELARNVGGNRGGGGRVNSSRGIH